MTLRNQQLCREAAAALRRLRNKATEEITLDFLVDNDKEKYLERLTKIRDEYIGSVGLVHSLLSDDSEEENSN